MHSFFYVGFVWVKILRTLMPTYVIIEDNKLRFESMVELILLIDF